MNKAYRLQLSPKRVQQLIMEKRANSQNVGNQSLTINPPGSAGQSISSRITPGTGGNTLVQTTNHLRTRPTGSKPNYVNNRGGANSVQTSPNAPIASTSPYNMTPGWGAGGQPHLTSSVMGPQQPRFEAGTPQQAPGAQQDSGWRRAGMGAMYGDAATMVDGAKGVWNHMSDQASRNIGKFWNNTEGAREAAGAGLSWTGDKMRESAGNAWDTAKSVGTFYQNRAKDIGNLAASAGKAITGRFIGNAWEGAKSRALERGFEMAAPHLKEALGYVNENMGWGDKLRLLLGFLIPGLSKREGWDPMQIITPYLKEWNSNR